MTQLNGVGSGSTEEDMLTAMLQELQEGAVLESSVYLARAGNSQLQGRKGSKACRPARRLLRTLHRLGPAEGQRVVLSALRGVEVQLEGSTGDTSCAAFWWSNMLMLRYHLDSDPELSLLVEKAKSIEVDAFCKVLATVWEGLILPSVVVESAATEPGSRSSIFSASLSFGSSTGKRNAPSPVHGGEEVAIQRWLDVLDQAHRMLGGARFDDIAAQLEPEVMKQVLHRIDRLIVGSLVRGVSRDDEGRQPTSGTSTPDSAVAATPTLSKPFLPFKPGLVSFGVGLQLKLAMTRLLQWATETGCAEEGAVVADLLPCMASCASLLMLPTDQLADPKTHAKVFPELCMRDVHTLLSRFEPDDFCPTAPEPGLLTIIESQVNLSNDRRGTTDSLSMRATDMFGDCGDESFRERYPDFLGRIEVVAPEQTSADIIMEPPDTDSDDDLARQEELVIDRKDHGMSAELQRLALLSHLWSATTT